MKSILRATATVSFLALFYSAQVRSQESRPSEGGTVRVQSSLVLVDVIAQDLKSGLPRRELKKGDFRLFDNRREVTIRTFDAGAEHDTRPIILWMVVICNERGIVGASAEFAGNEPLFRPALDELQGLDRVGVAHWCDNGETHLDLLPTTDRDAPIPVLAECLKPIDFEGGTFRSDDAGEQAFRRLVRLIIRDSYQRNPRPLPVIVFLHGDHTGQPRRELDKVVDDFLETSGIAFGIRDRHSAVLHFLIGEQAKIMHYMAKHTGGQYFSASPSDYAGTLKTILTQLHFRYELGFVPSAIDNRRHELRVELTKEAMRKYKRVRLRFRPEYIPLSAAPEWTR